MLLFDSLVKIFKFLRVELNMQSMVIASQRCWYGSAKSETCVRQKSILPKASHIDLVDYIQNSALLCV